MSAPWLHVIGIGEDGVAGLAPPACEALSRAGIIIGGERHHDLTPDFEAERLNWPTPFDAMVDVLQSHRAQNPVVLVTGDPLWYSAGARLARAIGSEHITFHPQLSAFQWAATRMGWSLADCETLTVHGRAASQMLPHLAPHVRILLLTKDASTPATIAKLLRNCGFGESRMTALAHLGGDDEQRFEGLASDWAHDVPDFHTLAIDCIAGPDARWYPRGGGLPDDAFEHDGQMTKRDIRAATLAKLAPYPDALLWDVGAGCGSVGIEWMRAARGAATIAIEPKAQRRDMISTNAISLGTEKIEVVAGRAPEALAGLGTPDAVFIGGGLTTEGVFETCWSALRPGGRLVANGVTLETEAKLAALHREHGGELVRIAVQHAEPVGPYRGWRAAMPVTQWCVIKPMEQGV